MLLKQHLHQVVVLVSFPGHCLNSLTVLLPGLIGVVSGKQRRMQMIKVAAHVPRRHEPADRVRRRHALCQVAKGHFGGASVDGFRPARRLAHVNRYREAISMRRASVSVKDRVGVSGMDIRRDGGQLQRGHLCRGSLICHTLALCFFLASHPLHTLGVPRKTCQLGLVQANGEEQVAARALA